MLFPKQLYVRFTQLGGSRAHTLKLGRFEFSDGSETTPKNASLAAIKRDRINQRQERTPGKARRAVAQRKIIRSPRRVIAEQRVQRIRAPQPVRVVAPRRRRVMQGEEGIGHRKNASHSGAGFGAQLIYANV